MAIPTSTILYQLYYLLSLCACVSAECSPVWRSAVDRISSWAWILQFGQDWLGMKLLGYAYHCLHQHCGHKPMSPPLTLDTGSPTSPHANAANTFILYAHYCIKLFKIKLNNSYLLSFEKLDQSFHDYDSFIMCAN